MSSTVPPPLATLLTSLGLYPLAFYLISPPHASYRRLAQSREAISALHCTSMTILSLICLRRSPAARLLVKPQLHERDVVAEHALSQTKPDTSLPIITTRSTFANCLTAIETAYLLQDSFILLWLWRVRGSRGRSSLAAGPPLKGFDLRVWAWHHAGLFSAFAVLQWYIARGKEKGVLIIVMLMLMNASYVFLDQLE